MIPIWDKTLPTITSCLDATFRRLGGVLAYVLTDNEKTVTTDHVAGIAVRNPEIVEVARHYGTTIRTCLPADPESKGGSEATVRIAKADLVPKDVNLRDHYKTFGELEAACRDFCDEVNSRVHRAIRRRPDERLAEELQRLHPLPRRPFTASFGTTRRVNWDSTISVEAVRYSVPHELIDTRVWARFHGDELIVTAVDEDGLTKEIARHRRGRPGDRVLDDSHYLPRRVREADRTPKAASAEEAAFCARARRRVLASGSGFDWCSPHQDEDERGRWALQALLGR
ncbi:transposase [Streptomyces sp. NBRC 110611]|nr:transposase [Streptomyces sp. NBRC 110611]